MELGLCLPNRDGILGAALYLYRAAVQTSVKADHIRLLRNSVGHKLQHQIPQFQCRQDRLRKEAIEFEDSAMKLAHLAKTSGIRR